jgi:DNA-binding Lrp family transcriptional regulator
MRKHNGMRPQDIVILLKIIDKEGQEWRMKDLASELGISASEVTESIERSVKAGLMSESKRYAMKGALKEFLVHGIRYVFPTRAGKEVRGISTAHSAPPLNDHIVFNVKYVWPYADGPDYGLAIEPLVDSVPRATLNDPVLYKLLALVDAFRAGRAREREIGELELEKILWQA